MWKKDGKRREMGLGSAGSVTLAHARELADACRAQVARGFDPIEIRNAADKEKSRTPTFGEVADALIAAKESEWRNPKHRAQWRMTLTQFAEPLRSRPVYEIDTAAVLAAMVYGDVPAFLARLREPEAIAALALEFCILTAARSAERLGVQCSEIDLAKSSGQFPPAA